MVLPEIILGEEVKNDYLKKEITICLFTISLGILGLFLLLELLIILLASRQSEGNRNQIQYGYA